MKRDEVGEARGARQEHGRIGSRYFALNSARPWKEKSRMPYQKRLTRRLPRRWGESARDRTSSSRASSLSLSLSLSSSRSLSCQRPRLFYPVLLFPEDPPSAYISAYFQRCAHFSCPCLLSASSFCHSLLILLFSFGELLSLLSFFLLLNYAFHY